MARKATRKSTRAKSSRRGRTSARRRSTSRRWSRRVTEESNALDLKKGVFTQKSPKKIAASLLRSAQRSKRRKSSPRRSAISMLTFYINRAGKNLPASRKKILNKAKDELRAKSGAG